MAGPKCDKYVVVDIGGGGDPVTVPCTRLGRHRLHSIGYEWTEPEQTVVHENVFPE